MPVAPATTATRTRTRGCKPGVERGAAPGAPGDTGEGGAQITARHRFFLRDGTRYVHSEVRFGDYLSRRSTRLLPHQRRALLQFAACHIAQAARETRAAFSPAAVVVEQPPAPHAHL